MTNSKNFTPSLQLETYTRCDSWFLKTTVKYFFIKQNLAIKTNDYPNSSNPTYNKLRLHHIITVPHLFHFYDIYISS